MNLIPQNAQMNEKGYLNTPYIHNLCSPDTGKWNEAMRTPTIMDF